LLIRLDTSWGEQDLADLIGIILPQVIASLFIAGRVISRLHVLGIWSWDDTLIVFACINSLALKVLFAIGTLFGQGHHIDDVPINLLDASFQITFVTLIIYQFALCLTKISILVFYLRVFPGRREKWMAWSTIICVAAYGLPLIVTDIRQCNPVTQGNFFDGGVCLSPMPVLIASTVLHTTTDAWIIVMVIPVVLTLQIPPRQRWALMGVLSIGIFIILASIGRIVSIVKLGSNDYTYSIGDFDTWSVVEVTVGLICACAPTIRPLLLRLFPKLMSSRSRSDDTRIGDGAIVLASRRHRKLVPDSPRSDGSQKGSMKFLESESEENLVAEPVRIAHSAHFSEGPGPLSRNATHDLESRDEKNTNSGWSSDGRRF